MLSIAYISDQPVRKQPKKSAEPSYKQWMRRQQHKDYLKACAELKDRIEAIQQHEPGWMP
ncbi:MAG: hypothetical protein K0S09_59 [Sphingobacteriaceae bacterium]|jgi:thiaminase|nr:hypothetical protein [Sphingobacteriaceae bacterium]